MREVEAEEQITEEFRQVVSVVQELTGLKSRWQGTTRLVTREAQILSRRPFSARKDWDCGLTVAVPLVGDDLRWRTLIHEALHSVSVGLSERDYQTHLGWEEATVEAMQRQLRPILLPRLGVSVAEMLFVQAEDAWLYNRYLAALRQVAAELGSVPETEFFQTLLRTRLGDRKTFVFAWGKQAAGDFDRFKRVYAASSGVLSR